MQDKPQFKDIDGYISLQEETIIPKLEQIRQIIRQCAPKAEEVISYSMPAFRGNRILIWFAAGKKHIGIYPYPHTIKHFESRLDAYELSKGAIRLPLDKPIPVKLLKDMVKYLLNADAQKVPVKKPAAKK